MDAAPYIATLLFDDASNARLSQWRARYFPAARNFLPAHLTLFHALPAERLRVSFFAQAATEQAPFPLRFEKLRRLSGGMAVHVEAPLLRPLRGSLATHFEGALTAQDAAPHTPHVTLMNKASREEAEAAFEELSAVFTPWKGVARGLALWRYRGGPWEAVAEFPFAGLKPST